MAEVFNRVAKGPNFINSNLNQWLNLYEVETDSTGAMIFGLTISNVTGLNINANANVTGNGTFDPSDITVQVRIIDNANNLINSIIPSRTLEAGGGYDSSNKIVMKPGDILQVQTNTAGVVFYASIISGVQIEA